MEFDRQMIDLVREIRRRSPSETKPGIKLANPELLFELIPVFQKSRDTILKTLVKELFTMAGDGWPERLHSPSKDTDKRFITKVYRGQTQLVEVTGQQEDVAPVKPLKIYRGQPVA